MMAADEKKTKPTEKAPPKEKAAVEAPAKGKPTEAAPASESKTEAKPDTPKNYSRGEGQKAVTQAYKDNWNAIFAKKKKKR